jgi:hypothetical protein
MVKDEYVQSGKVKKEGRKEAAQLCCHVGIAAADGQVQLKEEEADLAKDFC